MWTSFRVPSVAVVVCLRMVCKDDVVDLQASAGEGLADLCILPFLPRRMRVLLRSVRLHVHVGSASGGEGVHLSGVFPPDVDARSLEIGLAKRPVIDDSAVVPAVPSQLGDPSSGGISAGLPTDVPTFFCREFLGACDRSSWRSFWSSIQRSAKMIKYR